MRLSFIGFLAVMASSSGCFRDEGGLMSGWKPAPDAQCLSNVTIQSLANGLFTSAEINYPEGFQGMLRAQAQHPGPVGIVYDV
jgi:hypothetical protein